MTGSGDGIRAPRALRDEIERAADIVNTDRRGRRRPGMGTITQYAYTPHGMRTGIGKPCRNVPEWCVYARRGCIISEPAPLVVSCPAIFCDTNIDPVSAAIAIGRPDLDEMHSCARYTECLKCAGCIGGVYKGVYMLSIVRRAHRRSSALAWIGENIMDQVCDMINMDCRIGFKMNHGMDPDACFWRHARKKDD